MDNYISVKYLVSAACLSLWVRFWYHLRMVERDSYPQVSVDDKILDFLLDIPDAALPWVYGAIISQLRWRRELDVQDLADIYDQWRQLH